MDNFSGQVVFITGASSGIGAALAREFARQGADLALLARREDRLVALGAELDRRYGRCVLPLRADVTQDGSVEQAAARTREALGRIDVVVANAGFGVVGRVDRLAIEDYRRQFEINVFGVLRTLYATLDDLKRSRGRLVLVGSVAGHLAAPGGSPYAMSKFAVRALAQSVRYDLMSHGISVVLLSPGYVDTEIRHVNNRGEVDPATRSTVPDWLCMPADRAARHMVRAVAKRQPEAIISLHGKLGVFLQRHTPWVLSSLFRRVRVPSAD